MIYELAYMPVFGLDLVIWMGIMAFALMMVAALAGAGPRRGIRLLPVRWHARLGMVSALFAVAHVVLALGGRFGI